MTRPKLTLVEFGAYRVTTVAGRTLYLLYRGRAGKRLWFTELDPPYGSVLLRPMWITEAKPLAECQKPDTDA